MRPRTKRILFFAIMIVTFLAMGWVIVTKLNEARREIVEGQGARPAAPVRP
ncbi:MAG: hypothetical protein QGD94_12200 [Planctomycetia bacterium]|nr:hypothetical protein [Planctomycetia bacterium]